jgi:parvulin-like peptidyl-prolyl isomerase
MQEILPAAIFHGGVSTEKRQQYREQAIGMMVENELLAQYALSLGLEPDDEEIDAQVEAAMGRMGGVERYREALKATGITPEQYEAWLRRAVLKKLADQEIARQAAVTDEEVRAHYDGHMQSYFRPEARRVSHILVKVDPSSSPEQIAERLARAEELRQMIVDGQDFKDVAWDHSEGPFRVKSGDLGLLHKGRLDPELERVVWSLDAGVLSEPIHTIYGFHIVRVEAIEPPTQLGFEGVAGRIRQKLEGERLAEVRSALLERLRAEARIVSFDEPEPEPEAPAPGPAGGQVTE